MTRPRGYALRLDGHVFDLDEFERLVGAAADGEPSVRAATLRKALSLWRGPALADVELPFVQSETARLEQLRLAALEERIEADLMLGRHAELVPELESHVREHPLRERLRGQLILALYRSARQADALETYREGRRYLADELGLEPSPELRELERLILLQDPTLAPPAREDAAASGPVPDRRSQRSLRLLALVALAGLAAAGTALGVVLTTGSGGKSIAAARAAPQRQTTRRVRARPHSRLRPAVHVTRRRPARKPAVPGKTRRKVVRVVPPTRTVVLLEKVQAAPAQTPRSTPKPVVTKPPPPTRRQTLPPPPTTTATAPTRAIAAPPKPVTVSDTFGGNIVDPTIWYTICCAGSGVTASEQNGHLEFVFAPDTTPGGQYNIAGGHFGTQCKFPGDFDARVDFTLADWPPANGVVASLIVWLGPTNIGAQVNRASTAAWGDQYGAWLDPKYPVSVPLADQTGSFRLARKTGILTAYILHEGSWLKLWSIRNTLTATIALGASAGSGTGTSFVGQQVVVDFDNFTVTGVDPLCPPGSQPGS